MFAQFTRFLECLLNSKDTSYYKDDLGRKEDLVIVDFNDSFYNAVNVTPGYCFSNGICAITISYSTSIKSRPDNHMK